MDIIAVFAAAAAIWIVGAVWYGTMSGPWRAASGVTAKQAAETPKVVYLLSYLCFVPMAGFTQYIFFLADIQTAAEGLSMGAGFGAFFGIPWMAVSNMYQSRPILLTAIDGAYAVIGLAAGGAVLGLF